MLGILIVSMIFLAGCGAREKGATLAGKVTYPTPDKPVTGGAITLYPSSGYPLSAPIKADGTFSIRELPAGDMKVTIRTDSIKGMSGGEPNSAPAGMKPPGDNRPMPADTPNMPKFVKIPRKYGDPKTTPLTYTVEASGAQTRDFNLID